MSRRAAFREGLSDLDLTYDQLMACLGGACYDVHLSDLAYWRCIPARVWKYTIGGYQVMKKWLSYRERALLGRDPSPTRRATSPRWPAASPPPCCSSPPSTRTTRG